MQFQAASIYLRRWGCSTFPYTYVTLNRVNDTTWYMRLNRPGYMDIEYTIDLKTIHAHKISDFLRPCIEDFELIGEVLHS